MIAVVMEDRCCNTSKWDGPVGLHLGGELYYTFRKDSDMRQCAKDVATEIRRRLREQVEGADSGER